MTCAAASRERGGLVPIARRVAYYPPAPITGQREDALVMRRELHAST